MEEDLVVTPEQVMRELVAIGFARATDYLYTQDDELIIRSTRDLPEGAGAAIAAIERSSTGLKVKFYDKLKALELLGKCCGAFEGGYRGKEEKNNLLEAILQATGEEIKVDDLPELQQAPAAGDDLVESAGAEGI